jgi:long-chain acyl-CoA synthetase
MDVRTDPLPRNANGKVMKRQLREAFMLAISAAAREQAETGR